MYVTAYDGIVFVSASSDIFYTILKEDNKWGLCL